MTELNRYKKRLQKSTSQGQDILEYSKQVIESTFANIVGHEKGLIDFKDEIEFVVTNTADDLVNNFTFKPNTTNLSGKYLSYKGNTYLLATFDSDNILSPKCEGYLCNGSFIIKGEKVYCYQNDSTYGSKGIEDVQKFYELDTKIKIHFPVNELTRTLELGQRLMSRNSHILEITEIGNLVNENVLVVVAKRDEAVAMDDFENNIAYNENEEIVEQTELQIKGEDSILLGSDYTYYLVGMNSTHEIVIDGSNIEFDIVSNRIDILAKKIGWFSIIIEKDEQQVAVKNVFVGNKPR